MASSSEFRQLLADINTNFAAAETENSIAKLFLSSLSCSLNIVIV